MATDKKGKDIETVEQALGLDVNHTVHLVLYGDAGVGKSTAFASMAAPERPLCVWLFDARGKDIPYHRCQPGAALSPDHLTDKWGTHYREVKNAAGALLVRIEYYHDAVYDAPEAFGRFRERVNRAAREFERGQFWGHILDSATSASLRARKHHEYVDNPSARDGRQWFGGETDDMENMLQLHLPGLPGTVGVSMHVAKTKVESEGTMVRAPWIRGRNFEQLATQWPEIYRVWVDRDPSGGKVRRFQTENDERWLATTVLGVADGAKAGWKAVERAF